MIASGGATSSGGAAAGSGGTGAGGASGGGGTGAAAGAGGSGAAGADAGDGGTAKVPFSESDFSVEHSADSAPNAATITLSANIPASTRFLIACRHARDNDTASGFAGSMTVGGQQMTAVDPAARGVYGNNQAGVHCFHASDPPTGAQTIQFKLGFMGAYDYMRITAVYFDRPAQVHAHAIATHASGQSHGQSIVTTEPAVVLAIYTKYYPDLVSSVGFTQLVNQGGFGGEALAYAGAVVQKQASGVSWNVTWSGQSSWGGSQLVAVVPK